MYEYQRRKGSFTYIMETRERQQPDIKDFYMYIMTDDTYFALLLKLAQHKTSSISICVVRFLLIVQYLEL